MKKLVNTFFAILLYLALMGFFSLQSASAEKKWLPPKSNLSICAKNENCRTNVKHLYNLYNSILAEISHGNINAEKRTNLVEQQISLERYFSVMKDKYSVPFAELKKADSIRSAFVLSLVPQSYHTLYKSVLPIENDSLPPYKKLAFLSTAFDLTILRNDLVSARLLNNAIGKISPNLAFYNEKVFIRSVDIDIHSTQAKLPEHIPHEASMFPDSKMKIGKEYIDNFSSDTRRRYPSSFDILELSKVQNSSKKNTATVDHAANGKKKSRLEHIAAISQTKKAEIEPLRQHTIIIPSVEPQWMSGFNGEQTLDVVGTYKNYKEKYEKQNPDDTLDVSIDTPSKSLVLGLLRILGAFASTFFAGLYDNKDVERAGSDPGSAEATKAVDLAFNSYVMKQFFKTELNTQENSSTDNGNHTPKTKKFSPEKLDASPCYRRPTLECFKQQYEKAWEDKKSQTDGDSSQDDKDISNDKERKEKETVPIPISGYTPYPDIELGYEEDNDNNDPMDSICAENEECRRFFHMAPVINCPQDSPSKVCSSHRNVNDKADPIAELCAGTEECIRDLELAPIIYCPPKDSDLSNDCGYKLRRDDTIEKKICKNADDAEKEKCIRDFKLSLIAYYPPPEDGDYFADTKKGKWVPQPKGMCLECNITPAQRESFVRVEPEIITGAGEDSATLQPESYGRESEWQQYMNIEQLSLDNIPCGPDIYHRNLNTNTAEFSFSEVDNLVPRAPIERPIMNAELSIISDLYTGLLSYDKNFNLVKGVANRYEISYECDNSGQYEITYKFKLDQNQQWSDGTHVSAHHFIDRLNLIKSYLKDLESLSRWPPHLSVLKELAKIRAIAHDNLSLSFVFDAEHFAYNFERLVAHPYFAPLHPEHDRFLAISDNQFLTFPPGYVPLREDSHPTNGHYRPLTFDEASIHLEGHEGAKLSYVWQGGYRYNFMSVCQYIYNSKERENTFTNRSEVGKKIDFILRSIGANQNYQNYSFINFRDIISDRGSDRNLLSSFNIANSSATDFNILPVRFIYENEEILSMIHNLIYQELKSHGFNNIKSSAFNPITFLRSNNSSQEIIFHVSCSPQLGKDIIDRLLLLQTNSTWNDSDSGILQLLSLVDQLNKSHFEGGYIKKQQLGDGMIKTIVPFLIITNNDAANDIKTIRNDLLSIAPSLYY